MMAVAAGEEERVERESEREQQRDKPELRLPRWGIARRCTIGEDWSECARARAREREREREHESVRAREREPIRQGVQFSSVFFLS